MTVIYIFVGLLFLFILLSIVNKSIIKRKAKNYSQSGLVQSEIKGTFYRKLDPKEAGNFEGYLKTKSNKHDKFAIAVYKNPKLHIGYLPTGQEEFYNVIKYKYQNKIYAKGNLWYGDENGSWRGMVAFGFNLSDAELDEFKNEPVDFSELWDAKRANKPIDSNIPIIKSSRAK